MWTPNETIWWFVLVFLSVDGGTGNWCTCPLWLINDWFSNLGFHVSCQKYACKWNEYTCKEPWRWLMWNIKKQKYSHKTENSRLCYNIQSNLFFSVSQGVLSALVTILTLSQTTCCSVCGPPQSVAVLWESSTNLPTTSQFWLELQLSSIFSFLMEDDAGGTWSDANHVNKGPMTVNYSCRSVPPSPSSALYNEVSSLIKLIIYFIICPFPSLSIPTAMASQLRYSVRITKSKVRFLN